MKARDLNKYQGIFPAFYACYDDAGKVSPARARAFTEYLIEKGVNGLYVGGSSGECIYHSVAERKALLEAVIAQAAGRVTIIAHVACNNTRDSMELAAHAESAGADCIAAIPRSTSICRTARSRSIGPILPLPRRIRISSSTTSRNSPAQR